MVHIVTTVLKGYLLICSLEYATGIICYDISETLEGIGGGVDMPTECHEHAHSEFKGTRSSSLYWSSCAKRGAESHEMIGS